MARRGYNRLTALGVKNERTPGKYFDDQGHGLYLRVGKLPEASTARQKAVPPKAWVVRCEVHGKRRELGLGSAYLVSLDVARERAREIAIIARAGGDPFEEKHRLREARRAAEQAEEQHRKNRMTFEKAVQTVFELNRAS